jgi:diaminohydroxyphosphoribosylaminopyrimidine deaminase / 5-amino-6-(5-phosphoribosylamino)uracil reductase
MFTPLDTEYMKRALALAQKGEGNVSPNPMVGCVIVYKDQIIGEGYHQKYGEAHAEVNAINSVKDKSLISLSTIYVTLEPCSHTGKTPPCANLLLSYNPQKVIIASVDSNPLVGGKGIKLLLDNKIEVLTGLLNKENRFLNRRFFTIIEKQRPYIILKWAQTKDNFIARQNHDSKWISSQESRTLVHKWRSEEDSILVATNTALYDNPMLNVRLHEGKNPTRILLDKN